LLPFIAPVVPVMLSVVEVAPAKFVKAPPLALTCHCTVGVGEPDAAAVNIAVAPAATVTFAGLVVIVGTVFAAVTVKVAAVVVAMPDALVKTARYSFPLRAAVVPTMLSVGEAAPAMFVKLTPPFVLACHCTVGAGWPEAAAVNVAAAPAVTVTLMGFVAITGAEAFGVEFPAPHAARTAQARRRVATAATVERYEKPDRPLRWAPVERSKFARRDARAALPSKRLKERNRTGVC
jgi:hypothetical protein